jgi:hypothetical protein
MGLIAQIIAGGTERLRSKDEARLRSLTKHANNIKAMFPPAEKWNKSITEKWDELNSLTVGATRLVSTGDPGSSEALDNLEDWLDSNTLANAMKKWGVDETKKAYVSQMKGEASEHNPGNKFQPKHMSNTKEMVFNEAKLKAFMERFGLEEAEVLAIRMYTANDCKYINPAVANQKDHPERQLMGEDGKPVDWMDSAQKPGSANKRKELYEEGALHAGVIMEAFKKLPRREGTVYRGARMNEATFNSKFTVGREVAGCNSQRAPVRSAKSRTCVGHPTAARKHHQKGSASTASFCRKTTGSRKYRESSTMTLRYCHLFASGRVAVWGTPSAGKEHAADPVAIPTVPKVISAERVPAGPGVDHPQSHVAIWDSVVAGACQNMFTTPGARQRKSPSASTAEVSDLTPGSFAGHRRRAGSHPEWCLCRCRPPVLAAR